MDVVGAQHMRYHFPAVQRLMTLIPMDAVAKIWFPAKFQIEREQELTAIVDRILNREDEHSMKTTDDPESAPTLFHAMRDSDTLPTEEKNLDRFKDEASVIVGAAGETTSKSLSTVMYYLISNPIHLQKVRAELSTLQTSTEPALRDVQQLPYLTACIKEALRISCGFCSRSARSAPLEELHYKHYTIPANTLVSTVSWFINFNEDIFPNPSGFEPERWLGEEGKSRNRYFIPFGKGSRICLGQHLAWAEIYLTLAAIIPNYDFELFETTLDDVELRHEWMFSQAKIGSKGIRAYVKRRAQ